MPKAAMPSAVDGAGVFDVPVDFGEVPALVLFYAVQARPGASLTVGSTLIVGDGEGNRCPAVVVENVHGRVTVRLHVDRLRAGGWPAGRVRRVEPSGLGVPGQVSRGR
jgi:hypothetical protein